MLRCTFIWAVLGFLLATGGIGSGQTLDPVSFFNFETAPVHPIELSPDRSRLVVCNLADAKLEVFDVGTGNLIPVGSVPVGLDPVSVRFRNDNEVWVVNHISDSISVVDLQTLLVRATLSTLDTPSDVVFAGSPQRAFVSCALPNTIQVFDPLSHTWFTNIVIDAERPKALAVSADGQKVYAAIFESGNSTTLVGGKFRNLIFFDNAVGSPEGPYMGQSPPPNEGTEFHPPLALDLPSPPPSGIIVRKNSAGRWLDDNQGDWTEFISGTNAARTLRVPGWDLPDRDLAILNTVDLSVNYVTGLMNLCMAVGVNPVSGDITIIGTDAINEVRFEPNLNGIFVRVKVAMVDPTDLSEQIRDLNPHLDYSGPRVPAVERDLSIGDPRAIIWRADGSRGYVAGMGSRNLVEIDGEGVRLGGSPLELGEGPCGLALDEGRERLYVFNRFSSSISVVDTAANQVIEARELFDPTPLRVAAGRRHLYDTRRTSGLGQAACASCHADGRMDRLGWDLGNPAGDLQPLQVNHQGTLVTNAYHPMKGVMMTQTLQDIIGHEPFHWRGDRPDIEAFNSTFTNLQAAAQSLTTLEMRQLREFLGSIRFPPNPYRRLDNSLPTQVPLPGHFASGEHVLPAGEPLPDGNAASGFNLFLQAGNFCVTCHTLPTGLGLDATQGGLSIPPGIHGERHFPLAFRFEGSLRSKISQFQNLADKVGMDGTRARSRAGFGFGHDGSIDTLTRFLEGVRVVRDRDIADLIAFLFSVAGSDAVQPGAPLGTALPASVGRQVTLSANGAHPLPEAMLALAQAPESKIELIAKGMREGQERGWVYERADARFQSDRQGESISAPELLSAAGPGTELTFTIVPEGSGRRLGIDRDLDGILDGDENGTNPARWLPEVVGAAEGVAVGTDAVLEATVPPLIAPARFSWWKDGQLITAETNVALTFSRVQFSALGEYAFVVNSPFQNLTSPPVQLRIVPAVVKIQPSSQVVAQGSAAFFTAEVTGEKPFQVQWLFNGANLSGADTLELGIAGVQLADEGVYQLNVLNTHGSVTSAPVHLGVLIKPAVVVPAVSQHVPAGAQATFGFMISGHPPPFGFQLRRSNVVLTNYISDSAVGLFSLFDVQEADAGTYRIVVTNAANPSPGLSLAPVTLTILPDADEDGMPDEWEIAHGLDVNSAADAQLDTDADGSTHLQEYMAGTDPWDAQSFLRVERFFLTSDAVVVEFSAAAERGYSLQSREELDSGNWTQTAYVLAHSTNRMVAITNTLALDAHRYFRLRTGP